MRGIPYLPLVVSVAVALVCAACGQTGPLTLDRPLEAAPPAEPADAESGERDEDDADESARDGGER